MREILFHGKRIDNGEWVEGNLFVSDTDGRTYILVGTRIFTIEWEVDPSTVCQFTGRNDKNGKRIFEGDICKIDNLIYKVEFKYSEWVFTILSKKVYCCPAFNSHCGEYCEIIGNIHDNPELLEDAEGPEKKQFAFLTRRQPGRQRRKSNTTEDSAVGRL